MGVTSVSQTPQNERFEYNFLIGFGKIISLHVYKFQLLAYNGRVIREYDSPY